MQIGLLGVLGVVFIVLKLLGVITWSWLWVTAPLWIGAGLWFAVMFVFVGLAVVAHWLDT